MNQHEHERIDIGPASLLRDDRVWARIDVADRGGGILADVVTRIELPCAPLGA